MNVLIWVIALFSLSFAVPVRQPTEGIRLEADEAILVGAPWKLLITIDDALVGDELEVILLNGLLRFDDTLELGTGGVASWDIPRNQIMQTGTSLAIVRYGGEEITKELRVLPDIPKEVDLYTTANAMVAYGRGEATLMILPRDPWGNAPLDFAQLQAIATFANGTEQVIPFEYQGGLGWYDLISVGDPGRIRIELDQGRLEAYLEVMQTPDESHSIILTISPDCVINDGRDIVTLTTEVKDDFGHPVADGTIVTFEWDGGLGYGQTNEGRASLRLPTPVEIGTLTFQVASRNARSSTETLTIAEGTCP